MAKVLLTGFPDSDFHRLQSELPGYELCRIRDRDKGRSLAALLESARPGKTIKDPYVSWKPMVITGFKSQREQDAFEANFSRAFPEAVHIISWMGEGGGWSLDKLIKGLEESAWQGETRGGDQTKCPWCGTAGPDSAETCHNCGGPLGGQEKHGQPVFHRIHRAPPREFMDVTRVVSSFSSVMAGLAPLLIGVIFLGLTFSVLKGPHQVFSILRMTFGGIGAVMALIGGILVFRPLFRIFRK